MENPVVDCLLNHRSIRKFKDTPLPAETIELLLRTGIRTASAGNLQHYSLIVVDDLELIKQLRGDFPGSCILIIAVVDEYRNKRWFELNEAPFYFDQAANLFIGFWDAVIALHSIQIAAESLGLGTVYLGGILNTALHQIFNIPDYVFPAGMVAICYPDEAPKLRPRLPVEAVVHHNGYQIPTDDQIREYFREKDEQWNSIPPERQAELEVKGIHNTAQRVTLGHYSSEFVATRSQLILENVRKAKFRLP